MYRGDYQLIGSEMSFFTRKLEAQLRVQQIPWRYLFKTEQRLNMARLHVQDELLRAGKAGDAGVQALFAGRGILEHYLK